MIRTAQSGDLPQILKIYDRARRFMAENGNPDQWGNVFPPTALLQQDIAVGRLFVSEDADGIHAAFAFIVGDDPAYATIRDGAWLSDAPYGTIHRLAGDGVHRGIFEQCMEFCRENAPDLRADTHADNRTMQHLLEKHGFVYCGIVNPPDGGERMAYQLAVTKNGTIGLRRR